MACLLAILGNTAQIDMTQDYQLEIVELAPQSVLVVQTDSAPQNLGAVLGDILPRIRTFVAQQGGQIDGRPFMRYLDMTDRFSIDAGFPVDSAMTGQGDIELRELPGGPAITALFTGPPHMVGAAWSAVTEYAQEQGLANDDGWVGVEGWIGKGGWDVYVNDPEVVGIENAQTRLYLPLPAK